MKLSRTLPLLGAFTLASLPLSAQTLSGDIESDFELRRDRGYDDEEDGVHVNIGSSAKGTIGRGGPELSVNTVSGDIRLERVR